MAIGYGSCNTELLYIPASNQSGKEPVQGSTDTFRLDKMTGPKLCASPHFAAPGSAFSKPPEPIQAASKGTSTAKRLIRKLTSNNYVRICIYSWRSPGLSRAISDSYVYQVESPDQVKSLGEKETTTVLAAQSFLRALPDRVYHDILETKYTLPQRFESLLVWTIL